jgi:hypothetical protein
VLRKTDKEASSPKGSQRHELSGEGSKQCHSAKLHMREHGGLVVHGNGIDSMNYFSACRTSFIDEVKDRVACSGLFISGIFL